MDALRRSLSARSIRAHAGESEHIAAGHASDRIGKTIPDSGEFPRPRGRPTVRGKFLFAGDEKLEVRGVTYGTFRPAADGSHFPEPGVVELDFTRMSACGFTTVRVYTVPPRWLLDLASRSGLYVMVGLPWEQHIAFLDEPDRASSIEQRVREGVRACAGHPAVLCYAIGNEIPSPIVRWHGGAAIARFLERLYLAAKDEDPDGLVTYVNYPSTEYLQLPFLDFTSFNVYLESQEQLRSYLGRLQNLAGEGPLVLAELGLDSRRNGDAMQATQLDWQIRTAMGGGCAGVIVFAWTDEWYRGGSDIDDWDFGLVRRDRAPKPALAAVETAFIEGAFPPRSEWARISVVVCTYNGSRTLGECLEGLTRVDYPNFEIIVVDDGSRDDSAAIAGRFDVRLIRTPNQGLSAARNVGMRAATGEIVAYIDDDAYPDRDWLTYLAHTFRTTDHAGVGGPNIPPPDDGFIAKCVAHAPGGPTHVLLDDEIAEHIPGCNAAFRKSCLEAVGGFDPQFRAAGDDVDLCWKLQAQGWTLGFSPAAVVWHHRRNSVRAYWRQQRGYGTAEGLLERKWPEKYNSAGHLEWSGRIYVRGLATLLPFQRWRVYHGNAGSALFQSVYQPGAGLLQQIALMPEWYLACIALVAASVASATYGHRPGAVALLVAALGLPVAFAIQTVVRTVVAYADRRRGGLVRLRAMTAALHLLQPAARLVGRFRSGLTPWRDARLPAIVIPRTRVCRVWSEQWRDEGTWLQVIEGVIGAGQRVVARGGDFDRWDLEANGGVFGTLRAMMAVEEHGAGRQLVRVRLRPSWSRVAGIVFTGIGALCAAAAIFHAWVAFAVIICAGLCIALIACNESYGIIDAVARELADFGASVPHMMESSVPAPATSRSSE